MIKVALEGPIVVRIDCISSFVDATAGREGRTLILMMSREVRRTPRGTADRRWGGGTAPPRCKALRVPLGFRRAVEVKFAIISPQSRTAKMDFRF